MEQRTNECKIISIVSRALYLTLPPLCSCLAKLRTRSNKRESRFSVE